MFDGEGRIITRFMKRYKETYAIFTKEGPKGVFRYNE